MAFSGQVDCILVTVVINRNDFGLFHFQGTHQLIFALRSNFVCFVELWLHTSPCLGSCNIIRIAWEDWNSFGHFFVLDLILLHECICVASNNEFMIGKSLHQNSDTFFQLFELFLILFCFRAQMNTNKKNVAWHNDSSFWVCFYFFNIFRTEIAVLFNFFKALGLFSDLWICSDNNYRFVWSSLEDFKISLVFETFD